MNTLRDFLLLSAGPGNGGNGNGGNGDQGGDSESSPSTDDGYGHGDDADNQ